MKTKFIGRFRLGLPEGEEYQQATVTTRGETHSISPLNNLLATISADVDNPPTVTRAMIYEPAPHAEWVTKEIKITVRSQI